MLRTVRFGQVASGSGACQPMRIEQLDVAQRRDERALVLGRKRAIDPIEQTASAAIPTFCQASPMTTPIGVHASGSSRA